MKQRDRGHVDWERAVALRQTGLSYAKIAESLGCNPSAAYYAVNHERMRRKRRALRPRRDPWTPEQIIAAFVDFAARTGEPPRHSDLGRRGLPWAATVERRFGTLNKALAAAGLDTRPVGRPLVWTNDALDEFEQKEVA